MKERAKNIEQNLAHLAYLSSWTIVCNINVSLFAILICAMYCFPHNEEFHVQASASKLQQLRWTTVFEDLQLVLRSAAAPDLTPYCSSPFGKCLGITREHGHQSKCQAYLAHSAYLYRYPLNPSTHHGSSWTISCTSTYASLFAKLIFAIQSVPNNETLQVLASASKLQQLLWTTVSEDLQLLLHSAAAPGLTP